MSSPSKPGQPPQIVSAWIGLLLFTVYLLSFSGRFHVMDELAVFAAGDSLSTHGQMDINQLIWTNHWTPDPPGVWGQDGNLYTKKAPGVSVLVSALLKLARLLPETNAVYVGMLLGALITSGTASLLASWLFTLNFSTRTVLLTAFGYGLCTIAWIYARMLWGLPVVGLLGLGMVWALHRVGNGRAAGLSPGWLLISGTSAALALCFRYETLFFAAGAGLFLLARRHHSLREMIRHSAFFAAPFLPVGVAMLAYNQVRFGALIETGYSAEIAFIPSWRNLYGLTFSPGQGLFTYSPFLLLGFLGISSLRRKLTPSLFWLLAGLPLFAWFFYGSWFAWGGIWNWGPRFLLTVLPLLMLFVASALETNADRRWFWPLVIGLGIVSIALNGAGMLIDFNEYFARISAGQDFIFDWRLFPPLGNWRIFSEGFPVDLAWTSMGQTIAGQTTPEQGQTIWHWDTLLPALGVGFLAGGGLLFFLRSTSASARLQWAGLAVGLIATLVLTSMTLTGYTRIDKADTAYIADAGLLSALNAAGVPGDQLLITAPAYADFQELTTRLMAYQPQGLPSFFWMEGGDRGIQQGERLRVQQAVERNEEIKGGRLWLLERWHSSADELTPTVRWLEESRFLLDQGQVGESGRLSVYVQETTPVAVIPAGIDFLGGVSLKEFTVPAVPVQAGGFVPLRLHWKAAQGDRPVLFTAFVHLLSDDDLSQRVAESNRFLFDSQQPQRSPLRPGEGYSQGHYLSLPVDVLPGKYVVVAGLYHSLSEEGVHRDDSTGDNFVYLTTIEVVAPSD